MMAEAMRKLESMLYVMLCSLEHGDLDKEIYEDMVMVMIDIAGRYTDTET